MIRISMLFVLIAPLLQSAAAEEKPQAMLYKAPFCGCCEGHAAYLRGNGYEVTVEEVENMSRIKDELEVPQALEGCHSIVVGGYVIEGHVPVSVIDRLLAERPDIRGISLPGMPAGSPGMSGIKEAPFEIFEISDGAPEVYAVE